MNMLKLNLVVTVSADDIELQITNSAIPFPEIICPSMILKINLLTKPNYSNYWRVRAKYILDGTLIAKWRIYTSVNKAIIGSDNCLSPVWCQTIIRTDDDLLL